VPPPARGEIAPSNRILPAPSGDPTAARAIADTKAEATRFVTANMGDFSGKLDMTHMPNTDVMETPRGLKASLLQVADDNKARIEAARGGTIPDEHLIGLAQDLSLNQDVVHQAIAHEFGNDPARLPSVVVAARMIEQNNLGNLYALSAKIADGSASPAEMVEWHQNSQLFLQYREQLSGAAAVSGRTQRAFGIRVGMPSELPPEVTEHVASVLRQNNPDMQATAQAIRLAGTPQGIASIVSGMAGRSVMSRIGSLSWNMLQRVFINGILSGPPTWARILIGNNLNLLMNSGDLFASGIGRGMYGWATHMRGFPSGEEGAMLQDAIADMHGIISGTADAFRVAGRVLRTGQSMDNVLRSGEGASRQAQATLAGTFPETQGTWFGQLLHGIDRAIDFPGHLIASIDDFTKTLAYRGYMTRTSLREVQSRIAAGSLRPGDASQAMVELMQNPSEEMQQAAEAWAHRITFQSPFAEGGPGEKFQKFLSAAPPFRFIFPFMRTATNIFKQSQVERTPLAVLSARLRNQVAAGGAEGAQALARVTTGVGMMSMFAWMAVHDRITGTPPKDAKQRMAWEADGRKPNSVRITNPFTGQDTWRDYSMFEPVATLMSTVADVVALQSYIYHDNDTDSMMPHDNQINDIVAHIAASVIENTGNKTFMQGAAAASEMYNDPERAFSMWGDQMVANMMPFSGATKFVRNEQDPYMRQAFTMIDKIRDQLPTAGALKGSKTLPARLDFFGEARDSRTGNSILGPLSPMPGSEGHSDDITDEIKDLMTQTRTVPITMPSKQLAYLGSAQGLQDGQGMRLTPEEYNEYTTSARRDPVFNNGTQTFRERLDQLMNSNTYQAAAPGERVELIRNVQHNADKLGAKALWENNQDFRERMMEWTDNANRLKFNK
jgi:hypothetical protein